ncbi:MAG: FtsQ-type POTRA domain-containing protein [Bacillota bacterium]|nr:FtsQ-type POTRA domain-containing protein [Bacillota bacterium]
MPYQGSNNQNPKKRSSLPSQGNVPSHSKNSGQPPKSSLQNRVSSKSNGYYPISPSPVRKRVNQQDSAVNNRPNTTSQKKVQRTQSKRNNSEPRIPSNSDSEQKINKAKEFRELQKKKLRSAKNLNPRIIRRRKRLKAAAILVFLLVVAFVLSTTVFFNINTIQVSGTSKYKQDQIIDLSKISNGNNLFLLDIKGAEQNIYSTLPFVDSVEIKRILPSTVEIHVNEAPVAYTINDGSEYYAVSAQGRVMEKSEKNIYKAPTLIGAKMLPTEIGSLISYKNTNVGVILSSLFCALKNNNVTKITKVDISDLSKIKMIYNNRINVLLGTPDDMDYKIRTVRLIATQKLEPTDRGDLDVSLSNSETKASYFLPNYDVSSGTASK